MRIIRHAAAITACLALTGCAGLMRDRIYQPVPVAQTPVTFAGEAPSSVLATTGDGLALQGYYWAPARGNDTVVVYFHGNGYNQLVGAARAEPLRAGGHGVLVASYRGYGGNPGEPGEAGLMADAEAWLAEARRLAPQARVYLFGHSLGGAMALELAARHEVAGVATLGAFTRLADQAPAVARPLLADRYDNVAAIARVAEPVLLIHGSADTVIAYAAAEELERASGGRATLVRLPGAGHHVDLDQLAMRIWRFWESGAVGT
ncbi:alpha/beta fold hydrolase [Erythrobacter arachoides]|uniref:Alpha/beta fold hydrolase n=1 Tax=Aurantiacibacter arachoides TaxID=1850444 RepID=A0A845A6L7_9SPHN|nr:alpha/beta hydrolase [Aurantiacibacter arachoides]MXO94786.1 alpha/beta fold hydrolase [Aurantiacibacter arachoides]GGD60710.1 alpha/beta hydrolase [Aurantiacibacter arachoides]